MAKSGMFRRSVCGFHRQDVLRYIEEIQGEHGAREEALTAQVEALREEASALREEANALREDRESARGQVAELEALVEEHNRTNRSLREKAARADEIIAQSERLAARCRMLEQENARLSELLCTVRRQTEELRLHGQDFVAASCKHSDEQLTALEALLTTLEQQFGITREQIGKERTRLAKQVDTAGIRLQELIRTIEAGESAARTPDDRDADFFRNAASAVTTDEGGNSDPVSSAPRDGVYIRRKARRKNGGLKNWFGGWLPRET